VSDYDDRKTEGEAHRCSRCGRTWRDVDGGCPCAEADAEDEAHTEDGLRLVHTLPLPPSWRAELPGATRAVLASRLWASYEDGHNGDVARGVGLVLALRDDPDVVVVAHSTSVGWARGIARLLLRYCDALECGETCEEASAPVPSPPGLLDWLRAQGLEATAALVACPESAEGCRALLGEALRLAWAARERGDDPAPLLGPAQALVRLLFETRGGA
jgi:hypothetical protein